MEGKLHIRVRTLLEDANQAIDGDSNGLYDREALVRLLRAFIPLVEELLETSERELRDAGNRLRRRPRLYAPGLPQFGADLPSV